MVHTVGREREVGGAMAGVAAGETAGMCSSGVGRELQAQDISESVRSDSARSGTCLRKAEWKRQDGRAGKAGRADRADGGETVITLLYSSV